MIISAPYPYGPIDLGGQVGIYKRTAGAPELQGWLRGSGPALGFGESLSVAGDGLAVGAPFTAPHFPGDQAGDAWLYQLPP